MKSYLSISVGDESTLIQYVLDDEVLLTHTHPIGLIHIEAEGLGLRSASNLLDGVHFALEHISLYDRIPTEFRVISPRYMTWCKTILEDASYAQFFTDGAPVRVTLERIKEDVSNPPVSYARHSKTIHSFKV